TTSPMLQQWLVIGRRQPSADPYILYAAGNVGSLLALLAYPIVLEPRLRLSQQRAVWAIGYAAIAVLTAVCAAVRMRAASKATSMPPADPAELRDDGAVEGTPSVADRLRWIALAFIPSSLVLAVTTYLTTDIAAVPMLWVLPLALYLLTFVLVFGTRRIVSLRPLIRVFSFVCLLMAILIGLKTDL